jgi:hypothetical protein
MLLLMKTRYGVTRLCGLLVLTITVTAVMHGQQFVGANTAGFADTARASGLILIDPGMTTGKSSLLLPPSLKSDEGSDEVSLFSLWKQTSLRPPLLGSYMEPKADLTAPLRARVNEGWVGTLRSVLGTVQIGAVGYLAYRALTSKETPKPIKKK